MPHALVVHAGHAFELAHAGDHAEQALQRAELFHEAELAEEVVEVEFVLLQAAHHAHGLLLVYFLGGFFDEADHVPHAEDALRHAVGVEDLKLVGLFPDADELHGAAGDLAHGEQRAAAGVAVELGHDEAGDADGFMELGGDADGLLAGGGIGHEQGLARLHQITHGLQLGEQGLVHLLAAGGVEDGDAGALLVEPGEGGFGGPHHIRLAGGGGEDGRAELLAEHLELGDGGGAVKVQGDEEGAPALLFEPGGELGGGGGFARAVEAGEQDALRRGEIEFLGAAAEQLDKLVVEDFDDLLAWGDIAQHLLAKGAGLDGLDEVFGDLEVHVGLKEGEADFTQRVGHVGLADFAEAAQLAEGVFEFVGEGGKHGRIL